MGNNKIEEILKHGIHGTPETKPEERKMFLSTIVERIYLTLTKKQVSRNKMYEEAISIMTTKKDAQLFINGQLTYSMYSDYLQKANQYNIPFTIVTVESDTPIGLVLASNRALETKQEIFIKDEFY